MAQICADALGVDYRAIRVTHGQTDRIENGIGAHASRATVMTGSATAIAAANLRARGARGGGGTVAGAAFEPRHRRRQVSRARTRRSGPSLTLGEIARLKGGSLAAEGWHETPHMNYPYGCHIAVVRIDRETGAVAVERYLAAYDIGRAINPMLVEGQIVGGFAQGLGGALAEEFAYDAAGQPLSVTFADYLVPAACETPRVTVLLREDAPSPLNALGIKGAGEAGVTGVGAAIASAIDDAIGLPGAVTKLPVTPPMVLGLLARQGCGTKDPGVS